MRTTFERVLPVVLACSLVAGTTLRAQEAPAPQRPTSELITREQILERKTNSAYDLIEDIHNNWLTVRSQVLAAPTSRATAPRDSAGRVTAVYTEDTGPSGRSAPGANGGIQVYLDASRVGGVDELKNIRAADIFSIRRINGADAQARFGVGHAAGVIYVTTMTKQQQNP